MSDLNENDRVALANIQTTIGAHDSILKDMKKDVETLLTIIRGNGHVEDSFVYRLSKVEEKEKTCPIDEVKKVYDKLVLYATVAVIVSGLVTAGIELYFKMVKGA